MAIPPLLALGCCAAAALEASGGRLRRLAGAGRDQGYLAAGDEILWLARALPLPHPRAILLAGSLTAGWESGRLDVGAVAPWRPALSREIVGGPAGLAAAAHDLARDLLAEVPPAGLGHWLAGTPAPFPLTAARPAARALAAAMARCDAGAAGDAAAALLGLGPGLTPSGDDFVAGMLFASHLRQGAEGAALRRVVAALAPGRTNRISAALLQDAAEGLGFAALHRLAGALAAAQPETASAAARALVAIGHSSGWDMLSGLLAGLAGSPLLGRAGD